jgi:hypothetical protein
VSTPHRFAALAVALITLCGGLLRFYALDWGAPYHHFHIDEHFVFVGAVEMRQDFWAAGLSDKFFMYSPLPMYLLIGLVELYERFVRPLELTGIRDGVTFMVMGRAISAAFGTATIPIVYFIGRRLSGTTAGLLAAGLLAFAVVHVRDSHFFSVDASLTFFCTLTWLLAIRLAQTGNVRDYLFAGLAFGAAVLSKYSAAFLALVIGLGHLMSPRSFARPGSAANWGRWVAKGLLPGVVGVATFLLLDPLVVHHWDKFRADVAYMVTGPMTGATTFLWGAHFTDVQPQLFWFTNLLWWGLGPALEIWGLAGIVWLVWRWTGSAWMGAVFPLAYYAAAGQTSLPFMRYTMPLAPALAVTAAVLSADLLRHARWRRVSLVATSVVLATTIGYALAYMNVFRSPDARLEASRYLERHVPRDAAILVEPSHNIPPTGRYLTEPHFDADYVMWGSHDMRHDYYRMFALDTYRYLYDLRVPDEDKRAYIDDRVAQVDYILTDDTFQQFYRPLPDSEYGPVKDFYRRLFAGELGFELVETWKVYPRLFGVEINDDAAELSFRLFDHPRVFLFHRTQPFQEAEDSTHER